MGVSKISVRTFAWHDLITFYRYRHKIVCTDSARTLTYGSPTSPLAFLARFNPSLGVYTCINPGKDGAPPLIGEMHYAAGDRSAHIGYLMPDESLNHPRLGNLLEALAVQAGSWGAFHLLAEAEENSCAMEGMRRCGLSVYARQRILKFATPGDWAEGKNGAPRLDGHHARPLWQPASSLDEVLIRNLYQALVPPLVQSAEPLTSRRLPGWVYRQDDEILAYAEGIYGPHGIYIQPLIHPAVENVSQVLADLLAAQRNPLGRPIYLAIRSYQAWLEMVIRDFDCQVGPRQALMVKHLVVQQRTAALLARHSVLEKYTAEPTVPMIHNSTTVNEP